MKGHRTFKKAINNYLANHVGGNQRPTFFDVEQICPELTQLTLNFDVIKSELVQALHKKPHLPRYHDVDPGEYKISNTLHMDKNWNVFMLYLLGYKPEDNRSLCPQTCSLLAQVPNMLQAFFSILDPGKSIPLHEGPYYGYLRYHLGLQVPKVDPPTLRINNQPYTWKEGEAVLFDDSWPHEVINNSNEPRAVLIVDILRPLPWLPSLVNKALTYGLAKPIYGRSVMNRVKNFDLITTS